MAKNINKDSDTFNEKNLLKSAKKDYKLRYGNLNRSENEAEAHLIIDHVFGNQSEISEDEPARPQSNTQLFRSYREEIDKVDQDLYKI